jgi:hypothetical protein
VYIDYIPLLELKLPHTPLPQVSPQNQEGGGHTRRRVRGWGSPNSDDLRKSLALCLIWELKDRGLEKRGKDHLPHDGSSKGCSTKGIVTPSSNGYLVTVTEAKRVVLVTSLLLQRHKKLYRLHCYRYTG